MTGKIYKTAMGKVIDMGALMLENENTRAVGNMGVNARGDLVDGSNTVIDSKPKQVQRQYRKQTSVTLSDIPTSTRSAKQTQQPVSEDTSDIIEEDVVAPEDIIPLTSPTVVDNDPAVDPPKGGLAAAIAKSKEIKQELMKTPKQLIEEKRTGIKKI